MNMVINKNIISGTFIVCFFIYMCFIIVKCQYNKKKIEENPCNVLSDKIDYSSDARGNREIIIKYSVNGKCYKIKRLFDYRNINGKLKIKYVCNEPEISEILFDSVYFQNGTVAPLIKSDD